MQEFLEVKSYFICANPFVPKWAGPLGGLAAQATPGPVTADMAVLAQSVAAAADPEAHNGVPGRFTSA